MISEARRRIKSTVRAIWWIGHAAVRINRRSRQNSPLSPRTKSVMLRLLGGPKRLCSGVTRRDLLTAGGLGFFGLGLGSSRYVSAPGVSAAESSSTAALPGFGSAKNVILLYLFGGPSHLEMCDMKPHAAVEVRGQLKPIASSLPGCDVCEHLPNMARVMDRVTVVRSLTHPWNFHGMQYATTGLAVGSIPVEENLVHPQHQPFLGSVIHRFDEERRGPKPNGALPNNIFLPFPLSSRRAASYLYARPYAVYLGSRFDPICTEFRGEATRSMVRRSDGPPAEIRDPYLGIKPDCRFLIVPESEMPADVTLDRLTKRRSLLEQLEIVRRDFDRHASNTVMDQKRELAFSLLDSRQVREAFDLEQEPVRLREAYGMTLFGQATLQA